MDCCYLVRNLDEHPLNKGNPTVLGKALHHQQILLLEQQAKISELEKEVLQLRRDLSVAEDRLKSQPKSPGFGPAVGPHAAQINTTLSQPATPESVWGFGDTSTLPLFGSQGSKSSFNPNPARPFPSFGPALTSTTTMPSTFSGFDPLATSSSMVPAFGPAPTSTIPSCFPGFDPLAPSFTNTVAFGQHCMTDAGDASWST
jgi:hypothetical protein